MDVDGDLPCTLHDPALAPAKLSHKAFVHSGRFRPVAKPRRKEKESKEAGGKEKEKESRQEQGGKTEADAELAAMLATCSGLAKGSVHRHKSPGSEAAIKIWDCAGGGRLLNTLLPPSESLKHVFAVRWAPDGRHVTATFFAPRVCVWCVRTGQIVLDLPTSADVSSVEWSHNGAWLAVGMAQGVIELVAFDR